MINNKFFYQIPNSTFRTSDDFCYLSFGSNLGDRKKNIEKAIELLSLEKDLKILNISSILEYPSLQKDTSNIKDKFFNYLNIAVKIIFNKENPKDLLSITQKIESKIGKKIKNLTIDEKDFDARIIDIDILLFKNIKISDKYLIIPHYDLINRSFFIDLLSQLDSNIMINEKNILEIRRKLSLKNSFLMQIININNNSLSKDGFLDANSQIKTNKLQKIIRKCIKNNISIIDIGVISTAPGQEIIFSIQEEIDILKNILNVIYQEYNNSKYKYILPKISIDSFRYEVMQTLLKDNYYFDIINDQSGFDDDRKFKLFQNTHHSIILMHSLSLPVKKNIKMIGDLKQNLLEIKQFFQIKKDNFKKYNIDISRLIIDPGIGFGKTPEQSIFLLQNIEDFFNLNLNILIGHSRKGFLSIFNTKQNLKNRDIYTSFVSNFLNEKGVEFLRIHNYEINKDIILSNLIMKSRLSL